MSEGNHGAKVGWKVVDPSGKFVGEVEAVHEDHLVVKEGRLIHHSLYIPVDHVGDAADGEVAITIEAGHVDAEGWRYPPNSGFHHVAPAYPDVPETTTMQAAGMSGGQLSAPEFQGAIHDGLEAGELPN